MIKSAGRPRVRPERGHRYILMAPEDLWGEFELARAASGRFEGKNRTLHELFVALMKFYIEDKRPFTERMMAERKKAMDERMKQFERKPIKKTILERLEELI